MCPGFRIGNRHIRQPGDDHGRQQPGPFRKLDRSRAEPACPDRDHGQAAAWNTKFFRLEQRIGDLPDQGGVGPAGQGHAGIGRQLRVPGNVAGPVLRHDNRGQTPGEPGHGAQTALIHHFGSQDKQDAFLRRSVQQDQAAAAQLGDRPVNMSLGR